MTQRAADDYVAIKQALEQIEREKAAALDSDHPECGVEAKRDRAPGLVSNPGCGLEANFPVGSDDVGGKSFDEYLGMMIRDYGDQFNFKLT